MSRTPATPERAALHELIARHERFLLTTHINPDGDAIGSEVAFARMLRALGKSVRVLNDSPTPRAFEWLAAEGPVEVFSEELAETRFAEADALVVIDTGNRHRIGRLSEPLGRHAIAVAVVDHHVTHDGFGQVNVIEPACAAAAVLVYELMREADVPIDAVAAMALYVGLATDTGNFRYSNTDARALRMAADLSDWDQSLLNILIGQSGQILSSHYRDQWDHYYAGQSYPMQYRKVEAKAVLRLVPRKGM